MNKRIPYSISLLRAPKNPLQALLSVILLVFSTVQSEAQYFHGVNMDTKNFAIGMANFRRSDFFGDQRTFIDKNAFTIEEEKKSAELIKIQPPEKTAPKSLSIVHAFDVVHSISPKCLHIANKAQKEFDKILPLKQFERINTGFDKRNYLNQHVSYSEITRSETIDFMEAGGGTNYISGFTMPYAGTLKIASSDEDKRVLCFLTSVLNQGSKENIINRASNVGFTVFPCAIKTQIPETLKEIGEQTGGASYEIGNSAEQANLIYKERLCTSTYTHVETIIGRRNAGCSRSAPASFSIEQPQASIEYPLIAVPEYRFFTPDKDSLNTGAIAVRNSNFTGEKIVLNKQNRSLLPESDTVSTIPAIFYKNEQSLGFYLHSHGLAVNYRFARWQNVDEKVLWESGITYMRHPKEVRTSNPYYGSSEKFVFGKKNGAVTLHMGIGKQFEWTQKQEPGSIGVRFFYQVGGLLALAKPIYYEVLYVYDSVSLGIRDEPFSSDIHSKESIYGRASFSKGLDELSIIPGVYARLGTSLEFSSSKAFYHALEVGVAPFLYLKPLPIMAGAKNHRFFLNLFIAYRVGIITDNQRVNNRRIKRIRRKLYR